MYKKIITPISKLAQQLSTAMSEILADSQSVICLVNCVNIVCIAIKISRLSLLLFGIGPNGLTSTSDMLSFNGSFGPTSMSPVSDIFGLCWMSTEESLVIISSLKLYLLSRFAWLQG